MVASWTYHSNSVGTYKKKDKLNTPSISNSFFHHATEDPNQCVNMFPRLGGRSLKTFTCFYVGPKEEILSDSCGIKSTAFSLDDGTGACPL